MFTPRVSLVLVTEWAATKSSQGKQASPPTTYFNEDSPDLENTKRTCKGHNRTPEDDTGREFKQPKKRGRSRERLQKVDKRGKMHKKRAEGERGH